MIKELKNTFNYRYVVYNYVYASLKMRYRRSFLGFLWSVVMPLMQNLIIGMVFYYLMRFDMPNYIVYLFSGTVLFNIMSNVILQAPGIMLNNEHFIKKIYMPKLVYVFQVVCLEVINFMFIVTSLLILGMLFDKLEFSIVHLLVPIPIVLALFALVGISLIVSIATLYFRDMLQIVPVVMQAAFFLTPVLYPVAIVPEKLQHIIRFNPFFYYVEIFRSIILHNMIPRLDYLLICSILSIILFVTGMVILKMFNNKIVFRL